MCVCVCVSVCVCVCKCVCVCVSVSVLCADRQRERERERERKRERDSNSKVVLAIGMPTCAASPLAGLRGGSKSQVRMNVRPLKQLETEYFVRDDACACATDSFLILFILISSLYAPTSLPSRRYQIDR